MKVDQDETLNDNVDLAMCRKLVMLTGEQSLLEERAKLLGKEIARITDLVYPQIVGRTSQKLEGGTYVMPKRSLLVSKRSGVATEEIVEALKGTELEWLVRDDYQTGKLREYIGEQDKAAIAAKDPPDHPSDFLPEALRPLMTVFEKKSVTVGGGVKARSKVDALEMHRKDERFV